jgi:hypothetical protein
MVDCHIPERISKKKVQWQADSEQRQSDRKCYSASTRHKKGPAKKLAGPFL